MITDYGEHVLGLMLYIIGFGPIIIYVGAANYWYRCIGPGKCKTLIAGVFIGLPIL